MDIEQRIFELYGEPMTMREITKAVMEEFGISRDEARKLQLKVLDERGTPNLAAAKEAIEGLRAIRF